jgi:bacterioferritin-associated ferredoxin
MGDMTEVSVSDEDRRVLTRWAADCAERALPIFEAAARSDPRPREAIDRAREYTDSGSRTEHLRSVAWAALAAARDVGDAAAEAAARAAGYAAAAPFMHALASPHQTRHALSPAAYAAWACELATGHGDGVGDREIRRAAEHAPSAVRDLVRRMPVCGPGRSRANELERQLDAALRD